MSESAAASRSDFWIWGLVLAATCSVVALAVAQGSRPQAQVAGKSAPDVALPLLGGGRSRLPGQGDAGRLLGHLVRSLPRLDAARAAAV